MIALLLAVSAFAQAFGGSWLCYEQKMQVPWEIAEAPGSAWTTVRWGNQTNENGGVAYVGYIEKPGRWIYRDFHYDGSYADLNGTQTGNHWRWTGPYYRGKQEFDGDILWTLSSRVRIDRTFRALIGGRLKPTGSDYCVRSAAAPRPQ